jgi:hypothetical protein
LTSRAGSHLPAHRVASPHGRSPCFTDSRPILGLDLEQGRKLFTPIWSDIYPETSGSDADYNNDFARHDITREWAAATLRHLAVTGEVDWHFTRRFGQKYANINKASPKGVMMPTRRVPEYISS